MSKWERRARKWRKAFQGQRRIAKSWIKYGDKCERQSHEYRRQGNEAIREVTDQREGLLAWQRGVREAWHTQPNTGDAVRDFITWANDLRRAIEGEAGKEET